MSYLPVGDALSVSTVLDNPVYKVINGIPAKIGVSAAGAYHGYKRSGIGGALLYSFLGGLMPVFVAPIMLAQGFGKPKG